MNSINSLKQETPRILSDNRRLLTPLGSDYGSVF